MLRDALRQRGIHVIEAGEFEPASFLQNELRSVLSQVDLVIGVLTSERKSDWVLFELGQAWAAGRQILLFATRPSVAVPPALQRFLVIRSKITNREAVGFALDQLIAAPDSSVARRGPGTARRGGLGNKADNFLVDARRTGSERDLERLVATAFRESGIEVVSENKNPDYGADLAIWLDDLPPHMGNPVLVEIKTKLASQSEARSACTQLSKFTNSSVGSRIGLLLYGTSNLPESKLKSLAPPNILVASIDSFFWRLRNESLASVLQDLRNQQVHGSHE